MKYWSLPICLALPILPRSGYREGLAPGLQECYPSFPIRSGLQLSTTLLLPTSPSVCLVQVLHPTTILTLNHETWHGPCLSLPLSPLKYLWHFPHLYSRYYCVSYGLSIFSRLPVKCAYVVVFILWHFLWHGGDRRNTRIFACFTPEHISIERQLGGLSIGGIPKFFKLNHNHWVNDHQFNLFHSVYYLVAKSINEQDVNNIWIFHGTLILA